MTDTTDHALRKLFGNSRIGLGCMALTGLYGKVDKSQAISTIHAALDFGVQHFDTAELYGPYTNEELLAEALSATSNTATVATKFGYKIVDGQIEGRDSRPKSIRQSAENSLKRLKRDRIDLFYQHRPDPDVPLEDVVGTMSDLRNEGKIDAAGLSGVELSFLSNATLAMPITAVQNEFSIAENGSYHDHPELIFVAHSPLGRGLLASQKPMRVAVKADDFRYSNKRFQSVKADLVHKTESRLLNLSMEYGVQPAVIALSALLHQSPRVVAIPGAKSPSQIKTCMEACELKLDANALSSLWSSFN